MSHLHAVLPILRTINAAAFPGVTHESRSTVQQLLEDNRKHHIFFNTSKFHNHVVHHLLDSYALGCSPERLHAIYNEHLPIQRPAPPRSIKITESNWKEHLENEDRWTDYMDFFSSEVQELGIDGAVGKYLFDPDLFARFFSSINHAIIHLGFGIEFKEPLIVAEGLSLAALEGNLQFLQNLPSSSSSPTNLLDIFEQVRNDERFQKIPDIAALLHEYISKWGVKGTEDDVAAKEKELFEMIVLLYAAPIRPGKRPIFDFSLMHSLTGSVFVHVLIRHVTPDKGAQLLKAHLGITLEYYVATARPNLHVDNLKAYETLLPASPNPWLEIVKFAIETNDVHATKVAYSLLQGEAWFGDLDGIFLKAAQITADAVRAQPNKGIFQDAVWVHGGLGFDGTWKDKKSSKSSL